MSQLTVYLETEKPFHDSSLTIEIISNALNISKHYITQMLNQKLSKNFYNFINEYRIKEAMEKLSDKIYSKYTVIEIAYEVGFNSKSVFNRFFKEYTCLTPTEYRNKQLTLVDA